MGGGVEFNSFHVDRRGAHIYLGSMQILLVVEWKYSAPLSRVLVRYCAPDWFLVPPLRCIDAAHTHSVCLLCCTASQPSTFTDKAGSVLWQMAMHYGIWK